MSLISVKVTSPAAVNGTGIPGVPEVQRALISSPGSPGVAGAPGFAVTLHNPPAWASGTTYPLNDGVIGSDGLGYISMVAGNIGHDPTTDGGVHWFASSTPLPSTVPKLTKTDLFGRTTMQTASIATPSLEAFVFCDDTIAGTPGAKAGAARVTDGAMTAGSAVLSTAAAVQANQRVEVTGAGAVTGGVADVVAGYAQANASGGHVTLVTARGGSTPITVTTTCSAQTVTYYWLEEDTAGWQQAIDHVAANGGGTVSALPGRAYGVGSVVLNHNVTISGATGKTIVYIESGAANGSPAFVYNPRVAIGSTTGNVTSGSPTVTGVASFTNIIQGGVVMIQDVPSVTNAVPAGTTVTSFNAATGTITLSQNATGTFTAARIKPVLYNAGLERMSFPGHGLERNTQMPLQVVAGDNISVFRIRVTNNASAGVYLQDTSRAEVTRCYFNNVCSAKGDNVIDLVSGNQGEYSPLSDFLVHGNTIVNAQTEGIAVVAISSPADNAADYYFGRIVANHVSMVGGVGGTAIFVETGEGTLSKRHLVVANNTVRSDVNGIFLSNDSTPSSPLPIINAFVICQGNTLTLIAHPGAKTFSAINCEGSYFSVQGNVINCSDDATNFTSMIIMAGPAGTVSASGIRTNGSRTITSVTGGTTVNRGWKITATGWSADTFLSSGVGTGTWTMSQSYTGTTDVSAQAFTMIAPGVGCHVNDNIIQIAAPLATASDWSTGISLVKLLRSSCSGNSVLVDDGAFGSATGVALAVSQCGWVSLTDNLLHNSPTDGILFTSNNDVTVVGNRILNCSSAGSALGSGLSFAGVLGGLMPGSNYFADNRIVDDRVTGQMSQAWHQPTAHTTSNSTTPLNTVIAGGAWHGMVNAAMSGTSAISAFQPPPFSDVSAGAGTKGLQSNLPVAGVTVGASPLVLTNAGPAAVQYMINGGTVSALKVSRNSGSTFATASAATIGLSPVLGVGDQFQITYSVAPTAINALPILA